MTTKTTTKSKTKAKAKTKTKVKAKSKSKTVSAKKASPKTAVKSSKNTTTAKSRSAANKTTKPVKTKKSNNINGTDTRAILIEKMAYYIAEQRGFEGGDPVQDWLAAERRVDEMLSENRT